MNTGMNTGMDTSMDTSMDMLCSDMIEDDSISTTRRIPIDIISKSNNTYYKNMINNMIAEPFKDGRSASTAASATTVTSEFKPKGIRFHTRNAFEQANLNIVDNTFYKSINTDSPFDTLVDSPFDTLVDSPPPLTPGPRAIEVEQTRPISHAKQSVPIGAASTVPDVVTYSSLLGKLYNKTDIDTDISARTNAIANAIANTSTSRAGNVILNKSSCVSMQIHLCPETRHQVLQYHKGYSIAAEIRDILVTTTDDTIIKLNPLMTLTIARTIANIEHIIKIEQVSRVMPELCKIVYSAFKVFKICSYTGVEYNYSFDDCDKLYRIIYSNLRTGESRARFVYNYNLFVEALECADAQYMDLVYSGKVYRDNVMELFKELLWSLQCCQYLISTFEYEMENPDIDSRKGYDHILGIVTRMYIYSHSFIDYLHAINSDIVNACSKTGLHIPKTIKYRGWSLYANVNSPLVDISRTSP